MLLKNARIRREALKWSLPPNNLWHEKITLRRSWLRVYSPYVYPLESDTSSHMGARYPYNANPHMQGRFSSEKAATIPAGVVGDEESRDDPTLIATTSCSAATKVWKEALEIPKAASTGSGGGQMGSPLSPYSPPPNVGWQGLITGRV